MYDDYNDDPGLDDRLAAALGLDDDRPGPMGTNPLQSTAAWLADRCGKLTGSRVHLLYVKPKKAGQEWSDAAVTYAYELVAERMADANVRHFVSLAMEHGRDTEDEARQVFQHVTGKPVRLVGFVPHPTIPDFGASPDGLVGADAVFEAKCPTTPKFVAWKAKGVGPEEHVKQLLAEIVCTGRRRAHFWAYDPRVTAAPQRYFHRVYEPTAEEIADLEDRATRFLAFVDRLFDAATAEAPEA